MRNLVLAFLLSFLLQSCNVDPSMTPAEEDLYAIPLPPGPVQKTGGTIDLFPVELDDYFVNPGIGWQDGPGAFGFAGLPGTVDYALRRDISWSILNPREGVFDWSELDRQLLLAKDRGNQYSFRVYTMVGEGLGGHVMPQWVVDKGVAFYPDGQPDYSSCVYQEEWSKFIEELVRIYDGNPDVAFIDISGYGSFNEWSWQDLQTDWDEDWDSGYNTGTVSPDMFKTLDGQARRRLADMFLGGSYKGHMCRAPDGSMISTDYAYGGFQKTQLLMPFAGIAQSSQYVYSQRKDVGVRYDSLGCDGDGVFYRVEEILSEVWKTAPVAFELCNPNYLEVDDAAWLLQAARGSIVHNNNWKYGRSALEDMMKYAGYRYFPREIQVRVDGRVLDLDMNWKNLGYAPSYPKMGQIFNLTLYLLDMKGRPVYTHIFDADISSWMPFGSTPDLNGYRIEESISVPDDVPDGEYLVALAIMDARTGKSINLPMGGRDHQGYYVLFSVDIEQDVDS